MGTYTITLTPLPNAWIRRHWLTVAFLFMALLVTALVDRQGRTIDQQQELIRALYADSEELANIKVQDVQKQRNTADPEEKKAATKSDKVPAARTKRAIPPRDINSEPRSRWLFNI